MDYAQDWMVRLVHEAQLHDDNAFITLTYDQEHLPKDGSLNRRHLQLFMKRYRKAFPNRRIRFFAAGEYGSQNSRPHFHLLIFNHEFPDLVPCGSRKGNTLYTSPILEKLWPFGFVSVGQFNKTTAAYVAKYVLKKAGGETAEEMYFRFDSESGEAWDVQPEFITMSNRPGIGADWFKRYWRDVYPKDFITIEGKKYPAPKYYDVLLERLDPELLEQVKANRVELAKANAHENTPARLATRKRVAEARASQNQRDL